MKRRFLTDEEIKISVERYFDDPKNEEKIKEMMDDLVAISREIRKKELFIESGGEIFPAGNPRKYSELNEFEKDEVVGYLSIMTAPTSDIFVGDTPEEKYGIELLDEVALDMSK